jgi:hypothetical protein
MDGQVQLEPHDRWSCERCGQLLAFDAQARLSQEQLDACRGECDWTLVERRGLPVEDAPAL